MDTNLKNIIAWVLSILLGIGFISFGIQKILMTEGMVKMFDSLGYPEWSLYAVGAGEIILAIIIMIPGTTRFGCSLVYIWAGAALATHLFKGQYSEMVPAVLFCIVAFAISMLRKDD